jgi:hypothetical protein
MKEVPYLKRIRCVVVVALHVLGLSVVLRVHLFIHLLLARRLQRKIEYTKNNISEIFIPKTGRIKEREILPQRSIS